MTEQEKTFLYKSKEIAFDKLHRSIINRNMQAYYRQFDEGKKLFFDLENLKQRAANRKHEILENLDKYLIKFEDNFQRRGGKIIWAQNEKEVVDEIFKILEEHAAGLVVKSKSMTTEEIHLNEHLKEKGIEVLETDLGEYIMQVAGKKPYHIVTPAMNMSKNEVAGLFHERFQTNKEATAEEITKFVRTKLREDFLQADVGISGANFIIADTGSIAITENEGNALLSTSLPKVHIVIAGIEKLIPNFDDLALFWPLLSTHGTGQTLTNYNSVFSGPKSRSETDGPQEMYVILLDNQRTNLLTYPKQRQALSCIRCGACLNVCPVYKNIGGYTYETPYTGPIGSVISPFLEDENTRKHLSFASSLCGKCTETCPVKIPLHRLLLENRRYFVTNNHAGRTEKFAIRLWKYSVLKRRRMEMLNPAIKQKLVNFAMKNTWNKYKNPLSFAAESFYKQNKRNKAKE